MAKGNNSKTSINSQTPEPALSPKALLVLQAARRVFLEHGFSAATTDMIQRAAGVSKSTLYAHLGSKEAMFSAVVRAECAQQINQAQLWSIGGDNIKDKLKALARAYLKILVSPEALALHRMVVEVAPLFPHLAEIFYESGPETVYCALRRYLQEAVEKGELDFKGIDLAGVAHIFASLVRGYPHSYYVFHSRRKVKAALLEKWIETSIKSFVLAFDKN